MKYNVTYTARCPFYRGEKKNEIFCEGVYEPGNTVSTFPSQERREDYMDLYCNCDWESCVLAKGLSTKYE